MEVPGLLTLSGVLQTEKINGWFGVCSVGERKYCPDGMNGGEDKSGIMVNGKKCESKDSKSHEKDSNLSPLAPAGLIREGQPKLLALGLPWTMFLECPESHTEGLVGMVGISVP